MRALFRLGWREVRRHRLRSTLVTLLIGLPVAAGVVAVVAGPPFLTGGGNDGWHWLGDADVELGVQNPTGGQPVDTGQEVSVDAETLRRSAERTSQLVTEVVPDAQPVIDQMATGWRRTGRDNVVDEVQLRGFDQRSPVRTALLPLSNGRLAEGPGEVVVSHGLAEAAGLGVGDALSLSLPRVDLRVVGISPDLDGCDTCHLAAVTQQTFDESLSGEWSRDGRSARVLVAAPDSVGEAEFVDRLVSDGTLQGLGVSSPVSVDPTMDERAWTRVWTTVGVVFLLVWTGLIAATGLAVGARRRQRELGLLAANGADPRQLRLAVVAEGLLAGVVGSVGGAVLGVTGSLVLLWQLEGVVEEPLLMQVDPLGVVVWATVLVGCGLLAATLAARAAAVGLDRSTPNELLRGARRAPRPAPQWFVAGIVAVIAGLGMATVVADTDTTTDGNLVGLFVTLTLALLTMGLIALVVGASRVLPRLTAALPLPARLAGRDLQRHGMRVGASCGAVALTLTAAFSSAMLFESQRQLDASGSSRAIVAELPDGSEYLTVYGYRTELVGDEVVERFAAADDGAGLGSELRTKGFTAGNLPIFGVPAGLRTCWAATPDDTVDPTSCEPAAVTVVDEALWPALRPELRSALERGVPATTFGTAALVRADGSEVDSVDLLRTVMAVAGAGQEPDGVELEIGLEYALGGSVLVSEAGARDLGVDLAGPQIGGTTLVVHDGSDERIAQRVRAVVGPELEITQPYDTTPPPVVWIVAGGVGFVTLVTLLVVLFALALMRVEARSDDAVLAVVGASPSVARRTQAMRGGLMVLMAALPATVVGWGLVRVISNDRMPAVTPWWAAAIIVVALPLVTAFLAGLSDRPGRRLRLG